mgnify:FL=1
MKKNAKILRKLTSFPFLLVFFAFLFPLVNISCAEKVVANPNTYELVSGVTPETFLGEKERKAVEEMKKNEPRLSEFFEQPVATTAVIVPVIVAVVLAAICAFFTPVGSLAMALAAFVSLWVFIYNLSVTIQTEHYDFLTVKPAVGAYCITFLLIIGIAMNLTVIIRTAREKRQELGTEELK